MNIYINTCNVKNKLLVTISNVAENQKTERKNDVCKLLELKKLKERLLEN